jgi:hypothetical protein
MEGSCTSCTFASDSPTTLLVWNDEDGSFSFCLRNCRQLGNCFRDRQSFGRREVAAFFGILIPGMNMGQDTPIGIPYDESPGLGLINAPWRREPVSWALFCPTHFT